MKSSHLVSLVVSVVACGVALGATSEYGPPIRIASPVLAFEQAVEASRPSTSQRVVEWDEFAVEGDDRDSRITSGADGGYLRFVGVVGTGLIYVPDDSADRIVNDGLLRISRP